MFAAITQSPTFGQVLAELVVGKFKPKQTAGLREDITSPDLTWEEKVAMAFELPTETTNFGNAPVEQDSVVNSYDAIGDVVNSVKRSHPTMDVEDLYNYQANGEFMTVNIAQNLFKAGKPELTGAAIDKYISLCNEHDARLKEQHMKEEIVGKARKAPEFFTTRR